jgi:hypothetical protein
MRLMRISLMMASATSPLHAQSMYQGSPTPTLEPPYAAVPLDNRASTGYSRGSSLETPTMRREKLRRAIALRNEALRLQEEDGGVLSAELICPLLSGPSTMTVWIEEGTTNACQEAQARGDHREAA